jgi:anti-sigma-K factor RskA
MAREMHIAEYLPGYVLGCLEADETQRVVEHLEGCEVCRDELATYQEITGEIAAALVQIEPPKRVKRGLMEKVEENRTAQTSKENDNSWWMRFLGRFNQVSLTWVAASMALILILGVSNLLLWRQVQELRAGETAPLQVVALSGTDAMPSGTGLIVISGDGKHGTLVVDRLSELAEESDYQLWLIRGEERTSGGVFSVNPEGYGSVYVSSPDPLITYPAFGVTIEPKGGSPGPTGDKVLGGDL